MQLQPNTVYTTRIYASNSYSSNTTDNRLTTLFVTGGKVNFSVSSMIDKTGKMLLPELADGNPYGVAKDGVTVQRETLPMIVDWAYIKFEVVSGNPKVYVTTPGKLRKIGKEDILHGS